MTDLAPAPGRAAAVAAATDLKRWLFDAALPLWSTVGTDRRHGGFFEKIDRAAVPIEEPRRTRVVGRQIYCFATAASIGWTGPAADLVAHGLAYFHRCCLAPDGTVVTASRPDGTVVDARFDLYDHAFALFGLAAAHTFAADDRLVATAARMRDRLVEGWAHPQAGFEEARPRRLPLRANPHMHLLEAALAWIEALDGRDPAWGTFADAIAALCLDRFVDPATGAVREFFDGDWQPIAGEAGRLVEPGHQFEWSWLLRRWGRLRGDARALAAADRLLALAETHGTDPARGVAVDELWTDLSVKSAGARLWPQTERIKAWLAAAEAAADPEIRDRAFARVAVAARGLAPYLAAPVAGAWNERMLPDGGFRDEPSPASSLYHLTCAIAETTRALAPAS